MDIKDKIIAMAIVALISMVGWNLHETWSMKEQVFKLQQGQIILEQQIKQNTFFVKRQMKKLNKKNRKKNE